MDDELGSIWRRRRKPFADMDQSLLVDASRGDLERVLALEEAGPRAVQPVLVLDVGFFAGTTQSFLADLVVLVDHIFHLQNCHKLPKKFLDSLLLICQYFTSSAVTTPSLIRFSEYFSRHGLVFLILRYISGCVNIGSSTSLWPLRR